MKWVPLEGASAGTTREGPAMALSMTAKPTSSLISIVFVGHYVECRSLPLRQYAVASDTLLKRRFSNLIATGEDAQSQRQRQRLSQDAPELIAMAGQELIGPGLDVGLRD